MKTTFISILFFISFVAFAQKKKLSQDELLFEKAMVLNQLMEEDLDLDKSIEIGESLKITQEKNIKSQYAKEIKEVIMDKIVAIYQELIDNFPKSKLVYRALNNKGFLELQLQDYDDANETFLKILNSNANDQEKGGIGSGIMGEPYPNYKNRAAKTLAEIAIENKKYQKAIKYLDETKKYKYRHFCGNAHAADEINMATLYGKCYLASNEDQKAFDILLPHIIENGLASNDRLVQLTFNALIKKYHKQDLRKQLEESFKNYYIIKEKGKEDEYERFYIKFLNIQIEIELGPWNLGYHNKDEEKMGIDKILRHLPFINYCYNTTPTY